MSSALQIKSRPGGNILKSRRVPGFVLMEACYPPNTTVDSHAHPEANMCISLKGTCSEKLGTKVREYKPLTLDYLPAEAIHSLKFPQTELRCFGIDISRSWLERMREASMFQAESVFCHGGLLSSLFIKLYREFHESDGASSIAMEGLAIEMLAEVSRQGATSERTPPAWLRRAVELLHAQFSEKLQLVTIAQAVGVHPVHLAREFRKHYRCTVGEYVRRLRLENACAALSKSEMTLSAIAAAAGFADQSHFGRTFKRFAGMSPARYRVLASAR